MPRTIVTGAAGFIGSHLVDALIALGHTVVGVDNLLTGSLSNIAQQVPHEKFEFIQHDITRHLDLPGPVDYVLHWASPASPMDSNIGSRLTWNKQCPQPSKDQGC